jgi:hypothetical protein
VNFASQLAPVIRKLSKAIPIKVAPEELPTSHRTTLQTHVTVALDFGTRIVRVNLLAGSGLKSE